MLPAIGMSQGHFCCGTSGVQVFELPFHMWLSSQQRNRARKDLLNLSLRASSNFSSCTFASVENLYAQQPKDPQPADEHNTGFGEACHVTHAVVMLNVRSGLHGQF